MNNPKLHFGVENTKFDNQVRQEILKIKKEAEQNISLAVNCNSHPKAILVNVGTQISALNSKVNKYFGVNISKLEEDIKSFDLVDLKLDTENKIKQLEKLIRSVEIDITRNEVPLYDIKVWKYKIGIGVCVFLDCILNFRSFQVWVDNLLIAIVAALLTALCIGYIADTTGKKLVNYKNNRKKIIVLGISIACAMLVFYILSIMRIYYYAESDMSSFSPLLWCLFNLFFYCIAVLLSMNNTPTEEQLKLTAQLNILLKKLNILKDEKEGIKSSLIKNENLLKMHKNKLTELVRYRELLLKSIEMERNQICAKCLLDYELRGGSIPYSQIITELQINKL